MPDNSGDTLQLLPGTYNVPALGSTCSSVTETSGVNLIGVTLEGIPGRPRPTLDLSNCQTITVETNGVLRNVVVIEPGLDKNPPSFSLGATAGGTIDGIVDQGRFGPAIDTTGTVENSFVSAISFFESGGVAINDTAQLMVVQAAQQQGQNFNADATVINSIAQKFWAYTLNYDNSSTPTATATMTLSHYAGDTSTTPPSSTGTPGKGPGTINADTQVATAATPLDLAADGIHETAGSPTVDAGEHSTHPPLPPDDFDGGNRGLGNIDVGADEFGSGRPTLNTLTATNVTAHSATLQGTINTNEIDNPSVQFLYGPGSTLSSQTTAVDEPPSTSTVTLQTPITGLSPNTTYSFLIESGSQQAQLVTFHTPKPPNPFPGVVFEQHSAQASPSHVVSLQMFCPTKTIGFCKGTLTLKRAGIKLGSASFLANHGNLFTVHVTLTPTAFNQLVKARTESVLGIAAAHDANGNSKTTSASITLKAPPRR
jgi:hypothetical protein